MKHLGRTNNIMNNKLRSVIRYIVDKYPYAYDLTRMRFTQMVYLIDLDAIKETGKQITNIKWFYDNYGPFTYDVLEEVERDKQICIKETTSNFGTTKYLIAPTDIDTKLTYDDLTLDDVKRINKVIEDVQQFNWIDFVDYVYGTEPVKHGIKHTYLKFCGVQ